MLFDSALVFLIWYLRDVVCNELEIMIHHHWRLQNAEIIQKAFNWNHIYSYQWMCKNTWRPPHNAWTSRFRKRRETVFENSNCKPNPRISINLGPMFLKGKRNKTFLSSDWLQRKKQVIWWFMTAKVVIHDSQTKQCWC